MNYTKPPINSGMDERFHRAIEEEIPDGQMDRFRQTFENAWTKRTLWSRIMGKPLYAGVFASVILLAGLGSGYTLMKRGETTAKHHPNPVLMPGQRIVNEPEVIALFPKMEHTTLIANENQTQSAKPNYMVHGYLPDNIQVVWEY